MILSGIFLGGAIAVRPAGGALLLAFLSIQIFTSAKKKELLLNYFHVYTGTLIFIILFGGFTFLHFGKFEFTSTTGPVNLLLGANDDATGGFNSTVFEKGKAGYIEYPDSLTYIQKGEFYQEQAFKWITENPAKWIVLAPLKLFHTYGWDDISLSSVLGFGDTNSAREIRILISKRGLSDSLSDTTLTGQSSILFVFDPFTFILLFTVGGNCFWDLQSF